MALKADQHCSISLLPQVRAKDLPLLVVDEGQDLGEVFLAIMAEKFVPGHTNLLGEGAAREILELATAEHNMVKTQNFQYRLVLSDVQSLKTGGGHCAPTTVSRSAHFPTRVFTIGWCWRSADDPC